MWAQGRQGSDDRKPIRLSVRARLRSPSNLVEPSRAEELQDYTNGVHEPLDRDRGGHRLFGNLGIDNRHKVVQQGGTVVPVMVVGVTVAAASGWSW